MKKKIDLIPEKDCCLYNKTNDLCMEMYCSPLSERILCDERGSCTFKDNIESAHKIFSVDFKYPHTLNLYNFRMCPFRHYNKIIDRPPYYRNGSDIWRILNRSTKKRILLKYSKYWWLKPFIYFIRIR